MERLLDPNGGIVRFDDTEMMVAMIDRLRAYEATNLTPEEIKDTQVARRNIMDILIKAREVKNKYGTLLEVFDKKQKECDQWRREALTYADQLGMLRIWFASRLGTNMDQVMEDCKTMFPDTKYAGADNS